MLSATTVLYGILTFLWLEFFWELYLSLRQYDVCKTTTGVPRELTGVMSDETFEKARLYSIDKQRFGMVKDAFTIVTSSVIIYYGVLAKVWAVSDNINPYIGEVSISCIWLLIFNTFSTLVDLPFTIYYTFVLEAKFGFNKQTVKFFVLDRVKSFILSQVLVIPISSLVIVIVKYGGDWFFVWLWATIGVIALLLLTIYPSIIAPIFDKYTPLPEGELRTQIETLAASLKFPLTQLYVVEGSKRSAHSNAYFYGLFKSKRIVLYDTLLKTPDSGGCQNDEILAVLGHELGHWQFSHVTKNIIIMQINLFLMFAVFAYMFKTPTLYLAVGFPKGLQPVLVGLQVVVHYVMMPYNTLLSFLLTCLSRRFEFQADEFAIHLGKADPLQRALIQLNKDNLGFPIYDELYSAWHHSHPPLLERIAALEVKSKKSN